MSSSPTVEDMMVAYAEDAVEHARQVFHETLDYSEASIQTVETLLDRLYSAIPRNLLERLYKKQPSSEDIRRMSMAFGGYVGEVMRRLWGGSWKPESRGLPDHKGLVTLELANSTEVWPQVKVQKRLTNGKEDNVWHYFKVLMKRLTDRPGEPTASGDRTS